jgi:hypothetical protein
MQQKYFIYLYYLMKIIIKKKRMEQVPCYYCEENPSLLQNIHSFNVFCYQCYCKKELFENLTSYSKINFILYNHLKDQTHENILIVLKKFYEFIFKTNLYKKVIMKHEFEHINWMKRTNNLPDVSKMIEKKGNQLYEEEINRNFLYQEDKINECLFTLCHVFMNYCYQMIPDSVHFESRSESSLIFY